MSTHFNLVGFFARKTRKHINGPVTEHPQEAITLLSGITAQEAAQLSPEYFERHADEKAVAYAKYTPFEKKWMVDWQLVPVEVREERAA